MIIIFFVGIALLVSHHFLSYGIMYNSDGKEGFQFVDIFLLIGFSMLVYSLYGLIPA